MGALQRIADRYRNREGHGEPFPTHGAKRFFALLSSHFWKLITLNLLFVLFSLPIVTLPAALIGLNRVLLLIIREGHCFVWQDFFEEFKRSFLRSLPLGLISGAGLFAAYYLISLGLSNAGSVFGMMFCALGLFLTAFILQWGSWAFALMALLDADNRTVLKNAWALMRTESKRGLALLGVHSVSLALLLLLFPISVIPFALIFIAFTQYLLCFIIYTPVNERILEPYYNQPKREGTT